MSAGVASDDSIVKGLLRRLPINASHVVSKPFSIDFFLHAEVAIFFFSFFVQCHGSCCTLVLAVLEGLSFANEIRSTKKDIYASLIVGGETNLIRRSIELHPWLGNSISATTLVVQIVESLRHREADIVRDTTRNGTVNNRVRPSRNWPLIIKNELIIIDMLPASYRRPHLLWTPCGQDFANRCRTPWSTEKNVVTTRCQNRCHPPKNTSHNLPIADQNQHCLQWSWENSCPRKPYIRYSNSAGQ